ncbi:MAG: phage/plasmid primase, P4 family, partial [Bacteroidota bacterium]
MTPKPNEKTPPASGAVSITPELRTTISIPQPNNAALQAALNKAARAYVARGWKLIPLAANEKTPIKGFKFTDPNNCIATVEVVNEYWPLDKTTNYNIGIHASGSGLFVVDFDTAKPDYAGHDLFTALMVDDAANQPPFYRSRNGGYHLYFRHDHTTKPLHNTQSELAPGVDTKGVNGYVVAPPSVVYGHDGINLKQKYYAEYRTDPDSLTFTVLPIVPDWLIDMLAARAERQADIKRLETTPPPPPPKPLPSDERAQHEPWYQKVFKNRLNSAKNMILDAPDGKRHETRYLAGRLLGGAMQSMANLGYMTDPSSDDDAANILYHTRQPAANQRREYNQILEGINIGRRIPLELPPPDKTPTRQAPIKAARIDGEAHDMETIDNATVALIQAATWQYTHGKYRNSDIGNGERFVEATNGRLRFVSALNQWYFWNGQRWQQIAPAYVLIAAQIVAKEILQEAYTAPEDKRNEYGKWAATSQSAGKVEAMLKMAEPYLTRSIDEMDSEKTAHLLTVANGTIDLRTGRLEASNPNNNITKMTPITYTPTATAPRWQAFLNKIFNNDVELITYIQRAVGYSLTGATDSQCLFFLYGNGANGKSTFITVLEYLLNGADHDRKPEYYKTTTIEAILTSTASQGGANPFLVDMVGMRLITANELPANRRLNEELTKQLTGSDTVTTRQLYGAAFSFRPQFKLWISGNYKPRISGQDHGIWRRIRLIPFTYTFTATEQRAPAEVKREFIEELPGILNWAVRGAVEWYGLGDQRAAFTPPDIVNEAVSEYRNEEDLILQFMTACCIVADNASANKKAVWQQFEMWCKDQGERHGYTAQAFSQELKLRWFVDYGSGKLLWRGIG